MTMVPDPNSNIVWEYFSKDHTIKKATCKTCGQVYSYKSTSGNLKNHLRKQHPSIYKRVRATQSSTEQPEQSFEDSQIHEIKSRANSSVLWNYFTRDRRIKKATCLSCGELFSYKTTLANLKAHLRQRHQNIFKMVDSAQKLTYKSNPRHKEISLWDYFSKNDELKKATCAICGEHYSYKSSTGNLSTHLRRKHQIIYQTSESTQPEQKSSPSEVEPIKYQIVYQTSEATSIIYSSFESTQPSVEIQPQNYQIIYPTLESEHNPSQPDEITSQNQVEKTDSRANSSVLWDYFTKDDATKKSTCKICGELYSYKTSTGNLKTHLRNKHKTIYESVTSTQAITTRVISRDVISNLWEYFSKDSEIKKATCKLCGDLYSYKTSTGNLTSHLRSKHPNILEKTLSSQALPRRQSVSSSAELAGNISPLSWSADDTPLADLRKLDTNNLTTQIPPPPSSDKIQHAIETSSTDSHALWKYFSKDPATKRATCSICSTLISYRSTTGNLVAHLRNKHKDIYNKVVTTQASTQRQRSVSSDDNKVAETPYNDRTGLKKGGKITEEEKKQIDRDLLDLLIDGNHPFSVVEERAFKKLCRWIPGYELPSRETIKNKILPDVYPKTAKRGMIYQ